MNIMSTPLIKTTSEVNKSQRTSFDRAARFHSTCAAPVELPNTKPPRRSEELLAVGQQLEGILCKTLDVAPYIAAYFH